MRYKYGKLRGRIIEKYGCLTKFSKKIGISMTSLSKKMTGKVGFSQNDITEWSEVLDIDKSEYGDYFFT